jgi:hypothetical protein
MQEPDMRLYFLEVIKANARLPYHWQHVELVEKCLEIEGFSPKALLGFLNNNKDLESRFGNIQAWLDKAAKFVKRVWIDAEAKQITENDARELLANIGEVDLETLRGNYRRTSVIHRPRHHFEQVRSYNPF